MEATVSELMRRLLSADGFMPHGHCYLWNPGLIALHVVSDGLITLAYTSIPFTLLYFVRKRRDLPFHWMFLCFGVFIVACGATHAMEIWTLWTPSYWLSGVVKAVTAAASVPTAILLVRLVPQALALPSPSQLRRAEDRASALLDSAPDAIVVVDGGGRISLVNSQTECLFGYSRRELLGQPVDRLVPERFREEHARHRGGYVRSPNPRAMGSGLELFGLRKDGSEFPVEVSLSPVMTEAGMLVSSAIRDATQRKMADAALKNANRELEAFSYSVAHDLRAPARAMSGFAQLLLEGYADKLDAEGRDWLEEIGSNARRMSALIDALLSLSRVSRVELKRDSVDLTALARTTAAQLAASEPQRNVQVVASEGLRAEVDPHLARALVENLVGNAWKFSRNAPAPRVEVGATERDGVRAFFVRDNGAGFDMAYASKLFVPFQRLHAASEFSGTGIGLATVQRIVHRHGGRVWAEASVGQGATFYFTLPGTKGGSAS